MSEQSVRRVEDHPDFYVFSGILTRCLNPRDKGYKRYGGRGIKVCERWREGGFWVFIEDMGPRPTPEHSIDRIDNDGHYEPGNCRWATAKEQGRNRRNNRVIEFRGERRTLAEWAEVTGIHKGCIQARLNLLGWGIEQALTVPSNPHAQHHRGMGNKRRSPKRPKYSAEIVGLVRGRHAAGESTRAIAAAIGMSKSSVFVIVARKGVYAAS